MIYSALWDSAIALRACVTSLTITVPDTYDILVVNNNCNSAGS